MTKEKILLTKEYLLDRFVTKKWSYFQIYKESGYSKSTINNAIGKYGLRKKRNLRSINLVGEKFGLLTVLSPAEKKLKSNYWNCECSCGKLLQASTGNLLAGNYVSCGCQKNLSGNLSPSWTGKGEIAGRYWHILQANSSKRGIEFNLTIDYVWELYEKQNKLCALTNWPIIFAKNSFQTASLDRINSSLGYVTGNVQWVHKDINKMKNIFDQDYFIKACESVVSCNANKIKSLND